jgi:cytosine/creatinine deaminase
MALDLVIADAVLAGREGRWSVGVKDGKIAVIAPEIATDIPPVPAAGRLLTAGLVECHIHLDKADILDRVTIAEGTLGEAVRETARAKAAFTEEDVFRRASRVAELAVLNGTTAIRTYVEIDPRAGMRSFNAIKQVKAAYAHLIDIQICAFAQEGLSNEPETEPMLVAALEQGADLVGGCSYTDPDPKGHISRIFDLAGRFGVDADFHVDFNLDPNNADLPEIVTQTERRAYEGRVACGHVTKLAAWPKADVVAMAKRLAQAGVGVITLPATDLFLLGRDATGLVPRGFAPLMALRAEGALTAVATNNVLNPFTPYGDANLMRMANLFANVAQLSRDVDLEAAFAMVSADAARMMGRTYGIEVGAAADLVLFDAVSPSDAVRRVAAPVQGWKRGRVCFERPAARLNL